MAARRLISKLVRSGFAAVQVGPAASEGVIEIDLSITVRRTSESDLWVPRAAREPRSRPPAGESNAVTLVDVDVDSVNGCFVNQRQVKKQVLREGDILRIADRASRVSLVA